MSPTAFLSKRLLLTSFIAFLSQNPDVAGIAARNVVSSPRAKTTTIDSDAYDFVKDINEHQKQLVDNTTRNLSPRDAAVSMNSINFLEELVKGKDTINEKYYDLYDDTTVSVTNFDRSEILNGERIGGASSVRQGEKQALIIESNKEKIDQLTSVVEYTGILWFLNKRRVLFQESVRITNLSKCGKISTIECMTRYKNKDKWVDCSRVLCSFQEKNHSEGLQMEIGSEILIRLPLFGVGGPLKKKISGTFEKATHSFFRELGATDTRILKSNKNK